ncbi:granzyme H-like isoform X1 [Cervus canadensis]|uniref:granzyme H-like isoform X1 n=1 Tax=Cervus canadensis TaxID=1574408 RepID=UPI001C9E1F53|nr:granzyme H-like isoform X1 [Cervus canadensis]
MQPLLLLMAFLLPPGLGQPFLSEEIIGGHEAKPHSCPYMALVQFLGEKSWKRCGGVLTQKDFVLTAAHCRGSSMNVTLGAHNIKQQERTQQVIQVRRAIRHPDYNPKNFSNDIMLLQLERKAKQTSAVKPLSLPRAKARVRPGQCAVWPAGSGGPGRSSHLPAGGRADGAGGPGVRNPLTQALQPGQPDLCRGPKEGEDRLQG